MRKIIKNFYVVCLLIPWIPETIANQQREVQLGFSLLDMTYKEFDDFGELLNREDGLLPGITGQLVLAADNLENIIFFSFHSSTIVYDGQTQNGFPVMTDTKTNIYDVQYRISGSYLNQSQLYAGLGYRHWERNILGTANVSGLKEDYKWLYGLIGFKAKLMKSRQSELAIDIRVTQMLDAKMDLDFKNASLGGLTDLDDLTLDIDEKTNFRIGFPWKIKTAKSSTWVVEPYFEQWDIGKSDVVIVTKNGLPVVDLPTCGGICGVLEPRSETRNYGVNIQLVMPF